MDNLLLYWVWLTSLFEYSSPRISKIYYKFSPKEAYFASPEELLAAGIEEEDRELLQNKSLDRANEIVSDCQRLGIKIVTANSPSYPRSLERLKDKPYILYMKGNPDCLKRKTAALIGTRSMTKKGREAASLKAKELIDGGYTLLSGLAEGIDSVGAEVSLEENKPFCVVSAVDIDKYYPASSKSMIDRIAKSGVVISEYPPRTNARYFPTRNRLIAALSDEVYVMEAPLGSGALITAGEAKKLGVRVYAHLDEGVTFLGCHELVKKGALPLGEAVKKEKKEKKDPEFTGTKLYIYEKLKGKVATENELVDQNHSFIDIITALTELELDGIIISLPGNKYKLTKN